MVGWRYGMLKLGVWNPGKVPRVTPSGIAVTQSIVLLELSPEVDSQSNSIVISGPNRSGHLVTEKDITETVRGLDEGSLLTVGKCTPMPNFDQNLWLPGSFGVIRVANPPKL